MGYKNTFLLNLYNLALSDNHIHESEMRYIYNKSLEWGVSKVDLDILLLNPHKVKFKMPVVFDDVFEMLYCFGEIILSDGKIDPREIILFKSLLKQVKYIENNHDELIESLLDNIRLETDKKIYKQEFQKRLNKL